MLPPFDVTYLLVAGNRDRNLRYHAEVLAAAAHAGLRVETLVVETNARAHPDVRQVADRLFDVTSTPWIAPAHRVAIAHATAPVYLYTCNHHMTFRCASWLEELIQPLRDGAAVSGNVIQQGFGPAALPGMQNLPDDNPRYRVHLQGGLWAGRVESLRAGTIDHPAYPHGYEDVVRSWLLTSRGCKMAHVPSVYSTGVRGHVCTDDSWFSVIHDYRSEP